jgi:hypothetical protein
MPRFTIRDVLLVMVIVGLAAGWWLDHRMAESRCNGVCNPIEEYADRLNIELHSAKLEMSILKEQFVYVLVNQGKPEDEMRKLLADDGVNWSILDERKPYSNPCYPPLQSWFYPWK